MIHFDTLEVLLDVDDAYVKPLKIKNLIDSRGGRYQSKVDPEMELHGLPRAPQRGTLGPCRGR